MWKRMIIMLAAFAVVVGGIAAYKYLQVQALIAKYANFAPPPEAVTSAKATEETWPQTLDATASFAAVQGVTVSAEESGKIVKLGFESGQKVSKGDLLVQLDIAVEEAQFKMSQAKNELARANLERIHNLKGTGALADKEIDDAESQVKQTAAEVESLRATIDRKTIRAPFPGRTGIREVQLGQYLSPGAAVVSLQTLDPIYLDFSLPQQSLADLKTGQTVQIKVDAFPDKTFEGKITAIEPRMDNATRAVRVQATLENAAERFRPGMFASVSVVLSNTDKYVTVPLTSVSRAPYGDSIYVVETMKDPQGKEYLGVRQQFVKLGPGRGDQVAILNGIKTGEEVVTSGLFKLHPGAAVNINNEIVPANNAAPKPADS